MYPEYDYKGKSSTRRQGKDELREGSTDVSFDYSLRSGPERGRITIIAKNWVLQSGGKIPSDVCILASVATLRSTGRRQWWRLSY